MTDLDLSAVKALRDGIVRWRADRDGFVRARKSDVLFMLDTIMDQARLIHELAPKPTAARPRFAERMRATRP